MMTGRTRRELAVLLGGLVLFALLIVWGQAKAVRTEAGPTQTSPLYGERLARATLSPTPGSGPTIGAFKRPTYVQTCWDFFSYESYAFGWFLATEYSGKYTRAQVEKLCTLFGDSLKRTYPDANKLYRAMVLTKYPDSVKAIQQPTGSPSEIMSSTPFSEPLSVFGGTFSTPTSYNHFSAQFLKLYTKIPTKTRPIPISALTGVLANFGKYLRATDDCVTINTAGAKGEGAKQAQSCALACVSQAQMSCGVCISTLGVNVASCAQVTCGAGAVTCGSNVVTCGATCGGAITCLAASCSAVSCNIGTCSGSQTCGAANTCASGTKTCGAAATCGGNTCAAVCK